VLGGGRVDVFEWVLLEASSSSDLTDWLDENDFPYDSYATEAFDSYVEDGFKFVTFRVSPDELDGQDCGTFGPIALSFETDAPIVPLRIATAHEDAAWKSFAWTVYAVSDTQLEAESTDLESNTRFSGAVDDDALNQWPALAEIAEIGDRVTELRVQFEGESLTSDLRLRATATEDFRRTETLIQVTGCDDDGDASSGCAVGSSSSAGRISWLMLGALFLLRARRRAQR